MLGQVAQLGERLETLESQFDLPAKPVPLQDRLGAELRRWQVAYYQDVLGVFQGFRFRLLGLLGGLAEQLRQRALDAIFALANAA